jgi:hypothetical protein
MLLPDIEKSAAPADKAIFQWGQKMVMGTQGRSKLHMGHLSHHYCQSEQL